MALAPYLRPVKSVFYGELQDDTRPIGEACVQMHLEAEGYELSPEEISAEAKKEYSNFSLDAMREEFDFWYEIAYLK